MHSAPLCGAAFDARRRPKKPEEKYVNAQSGQPCFSVPFRAPFSHQNWPRNIKDHARGPRAPSDMCFRPRALTRCATAEKIRIIKDREGMADNAVEVSRTRLIALASKHVLPCRERIATPSHLDSPSTTASLSSAVLRLKL